MGLSTCTPCTVSKICRVYKYGSNFLDSTTDLGGCAFSRCGRLAAKQTERKSAVYSSFFVFGNHYLGLLNDLTASLFVFCVYLVYTGGGHQPFMLSVLEERIISKLTFLAFSIPHLCNRLSRLHKLSMTIFLLQ